MTWDQKQLLDKKLDILEAAVFGATEFIANYEGDMLLSSGLQNALWEFRDEFGKVESVS